jgi:hypothetical protein
LPNENVMPASTTQKFHFGATRELRGNEIFFCRGEEINKFDSTRGATEHYDAIFLEKLLWNFSFDFFFSSWPNENAISDEIKRFVG